MSTVATIHQKAEGVNEDSPLESRVQEDVLKSDGDHLTSRSRRGLLY